METLDIHHEGLTPMPGSRPWALVGVVASGNLEILLERTDVPAACAVRIETSVEGFAPIWEAVIRDVLTAHPAGGLAISINDGGARPDTVALRLRQGLGMMAAG